MMHHITGYQKLTTQTVAHNTYTVSPATLSDRTMVSAAFNPYKVRRHTRYPKHIQSRHASSSR